ncbi:stigma-specific STIG1-like protein 4 [Cornus florida]|uniref:stigma-specific STIG1-like protein 4 n=1 Tax=Cornus florida TaxID=4283 RepID=UPI0028A12726|nr:stigma-specific STIG1-like protein 4 [Cornus florida]
MTGSHGLAAAQKGVQDSGNPTHFNFFRSALRGRQRVLWCANDPTVCLDREKNPWGGSTCCYQRFCKDTMSDPNHCGACGKTCAYGFVCCNGNCVDIQNDARNCGACFEECPGQSRCFYAMCDYGG